MLPRSRKVKPLMARWSNPSRPNRNRITNDPFTTTEVLMAENSAAESAHGAPATVGGQS